MIYILEFERPLGNPGGHQARYYLGWCEDRRLAQRLAEHRAGAGAAITRACVDRGIRITLVAAFPGTRNDERRYKRWKKHRQLVAKGIQYEHLDSSV